METEKLLAQFCQGTGVPVGWYEGYEAYAGCEGYERIPREKKWTSDRTLTTLGATMLASGLSAWRETGPLSLTEPRMLVTPEGFFCGGIPLHASGGFLVMGPVLTFECTRKQARNLLERMGRPVSGVEALLRRLHRVPYHSAAQFSGLMGLLDLVLGGVSREIQTVTQTVGKPIPPQSGPEEIFEELEDRAFEEEILSCVEHGRTEDLKKFLRLMEEAAPKLPDFSMDSLGTFRSIFIIATTLVSNSATRGGLAPHLSRTISDRYLSQTEKIENYQDFLGIWTKMLLEYSEKTARARLLQQDSLLVRQISRDVQVHIYEKITLAQIARRLGKSQEHLCRHFKEKTGMTIVRYIQQEKVRECKRMLAYPRPMPLSQIAAQLGFSSQNYMHTVFKRWTGISPMAYRNQRR